MTERITRPLENDEHKLAKLIINHIEKPGGPIAGFYNDWSDVSASAINPNIRLSFMLFTTVGFLNKHGSYETIDRMFTLHSVGWCIHYFLDDEHTTRGTLLDGDPEAFASDWSLLKLEYSDASISF